MSKAKLKKALAEYYEGYCLSVDANEMLNTKVDFYGEINTVAKIAHEENFSVEETAAFCAGIEAFNPYTFLNAIKNHNYEFHADVDEFSRLGDVIRFQLINDTVIPDWLFHCINIEKLGFEHATDTQCVFSENYGYFEIF